MIDKPKFTDPAQATMRLLMLFTIPLLMVTMCKSATRYSDPAKAEGSQNWGPKEVKITVNKMVGSLVQYLKANNKEAYLSVSKIRNRTSEHIDTQMLSNAIVTELIKQKIKFIDMSSRGDSIKEIEAGQTGLVDSDYAVSAGGLKSPNYFLNGDITDNVRIADGEKIQYLVTTLRLTDVASNQAEWQEQQEFLKTSDTEKYTW